MEHLLLGDNCFLTAEEIYLSYTIDTATDRKTDRSFTSFCQILQNAFKTEPNRKTINGKKQTVYPLKWRELDVNSKDSLSKEELLTLLMSYGHVTCFNTDNITLTRPTGFLSNNNNIYKYITLSADKFTVQIRGKTVNLEEYEISGEYRCTKDGIFAMIQQIDAIPICQGTIIENKNYEMHKNIIHERLTKESDTKKPVEILRSVNCRQTATLNGRSHPNCITCLRLTVHYKDPEPEPTTKEIIENLMPFAKEETKNFMLLQIKNSQNRERKHNRWDQKTINECLNLYTRSPEGYRGLRNSGLIELPSVSQLLVYKNSVKQNPGYHDEIFMWMLQEANRLQIPPEGRVGGILIDEMAIQEKLEVVKEKGALDLYGFVNLGEEGNNIENLRSGIQSKSAGSHILQIMFTGITGFRFPFAHFVSKNVNACELYSLFWEAVNKLHDYGFAVKYVSMDGAVSNRSFMHLHFKDTEDCLNKNMKTIFPAQPSKQLIFIMDPSHTFKKIRNNIMKSGFKEGCTRLLRLKSGCEIHWDMFIDAYRWDRRNPVQIHRKLTNEHLFPSQSSKMRNHLAEDVLDKEMLNLVLNYKDTLGEKGSVLDGAVELLQKTSTMINVFRDRRPLYTESDERLKQIDYVKEWFSQWKNGSDNKSILSKECMEDVHATIEGFKQLCVSITKEYPGWSIIPAMINSDPIENIFCQQRGKFNGNNTNPTALQYKRNMNSVILGQNSISKKSNSSSSMSSTQCENYIFSMKKASLKVNSRKRKSEQSKQLKTGDCPSKAPCIRL